MTSLSFDELPTRLDKYLRESTGFSRRVVEDFILADRVVINQDAPSRGAATLVFASDEVCIDDERQTRQLAQSYFVFFKPAGILTAASDPYGRPCLDSYLEGLSPRVFPVGRLDKDTTGLLLLTDDGDLAHMLLHPKFHIPKTYWIDLAGQLEPDDPRLDRLRGGVELRDGPARAISVAALESGEMGSGRIALTLDEGRNRQVRRMVRVAGLDLQALHRHAFGDLELDLATAGEIRPLTDVEIEGLWSGVGGRDRVVRRRLRALASQADRLRKEGQPHDKLEAWLESKNWTDGSFGS